MWRPGIETCTFYKQCMYPTTELWPLPVWRENIGELECTQPKRQRSDGSILSSWLAGKPQVTASSANVAASLLVCTVLLLVWQPESRVPPVVPCRPAALGILVGGDQDRTGIDQGGVDCIGPGIRCILDPCPVLDMPQASFSRLHEQNCWHRSEKTYERPCITLTFPN